ncbi:MAG TPA: hypothetical protein PKD54_03170 [Pirellulaceae bacterium]|nr:hypothetical protein [Pirellulaceae bacterium]
MLEIEKPLGYLNFSTGNHDPAFFVHLDEVYRHLAGADGPSPGPNMVEQFLNEELRRLQGTNPIFAECRQAQAAIELCFRHVIPAFREFHFDVLFHQPDDFIFNSFFVGRVFEIILSLDLVHQSAEELTPIALRRLNDYCGHRPLPTLETHKAEPYLHERIRPVPLYIKGAGVSFGPYAQLVLGALEILRETRPTLLWNAEFDIDRLHELAVDPRPLDFDHPVNKRPNHHFGEWDENSVTLRGDYSRFIVHRVTLDALLDRVARDDQHLPTDELMREASAVLACTILMSSGISGRGPAAHDSSMSLAKMVPIIVNYRDQFYDELIERLPPPHRDRLQLEARQRHQPFGAARQDINHNLAQQRERQLIRCRLASLYARMGYDQTALEQADFVAVVSARIHCHIDCRLSALRRAIAGGQLEQAIPLVSEVFELLKRGIDCGAIVDPWGILGFDGSYPLTPHPEDSIRDHRVDELVDLMNYLFSRCARMWADAAAADRTDLCAQIREKFLEIAQWWRQFAAHEVMSVDALDPLEAYDSAELVARALQLWHRGGAAAGSIEFWAQHAELFHSPSAYWLVTQALLDRGDYVTSQSLLIHWLSQGESIPLAQPDASFHELVRRWVVEQRKTINTENPLPALDVWKRIRKFYDFLEVNAGHYWHVPTFVLGRPAGTNGRSEPDDELQSDEYEEEDANSVLDAAYDEMIFQSETDDGFEGSVFEPDNQLDTELTAEGDRILDRLQFLDCLSALWEVAATFPLPTPGARRKLPAKTESFWKSLLSERLSSMTVWLDQALIIRDGLRDLLRSINAYEVPNTGVDSESLEQYDRHRLFKETLVQNVIESCERCENAVRALQASRQAVGYLLGQQPLDKVDERLADDQPMLSVYAAILLRAPKLIVDRFPDLIEYLLFRRLLYVPLARGGDPEEIVQFRATQAALRELLSCLPNLGLLVETCALTQTAMTMERNSPFSQGAITEFDELFYVAYTSLVTAVIRAAQQDNSGKTSETSETKSTTRLSRRRKMNKAKPDLLFDCIEGLTQSMLVLWLDHSRTLRLSILETASDKRTWTLLVRFIQKYGGDLFSQLFLRLANVRAILHQGVESWLFQMQKADLETPPKLLDDIDRELPHRQAVRWLTLILEAIIESYGRYQEYNTTTTQSDRGELLYVLLDFLRLEKQYDRVCWHLKPVIWAHQVMVRMQETGVAKTWRRSLMERVSPEAESYLKKLQKLREKYSVQLPSLGHHMEGRFVQPMYVDRLVALVSTAMQDPSSRKSKSAFEIIAHECQSLLDTSSGVGMKVPDWLAALEAEVELIMFPERQHDPTQHWVPLVEPVAIKLEDVFDQLARLPKHKMENY